ncbi:hypothetical protein JH06_4453 [Blastocystis sp. subtype 4]|uniref:hypothetical protein n=1 Tax=Blastocystis sp. subtype 4 TaxID=944170 RepID=UPI000711C147|nr:hypothetical protein JH06_4453 [Blastocystis sp. subtype 4]KNB42096.1 hypothetical protein JH06_4453 [Blastocystis sp. subtype 4]|eukprot:XP_014525539.1 hypothetical protein JH06_4453 [Blastocystis sp. subtype 4]
MAGTYTTCFENGNSFPVDLFFQYKSGIEAKDYSHLAQLQNILEVDTQTQWIIDSLYAVQDAVDVIQEHEDEIRSIAMDLDYKVIFFSGITIAVLIILSILQTCMLKRRLVKAKLL